MANETCLSQWRAELKVRAETLLAVTHFHELDHPFVIDKADNCQEGSEGEGTADILMILGRAGKVKRAPILGPINTNLPFTKTKNSLSSRAKILSPGRVRSRNRCFPVAFNQLLL